MIIYKDKWVRIETEESEIPWLKIFVRQSCKEMSDCDKQTRQRIWLLLDIIERQMLDYYTPDKINIASFANYVPQVHWHIMARFKEDSYFPEPMWGTKQREANLNLPSVDIFIQELQKKLELYP